MATIGFMSIPFLAKKDLDLLQDKVQVKDCIVENKLDFGQTKELPNQIRKVITKGRHGSIVDVYSVRPDGKTYRFLNQEALLWTDINLTYIIYPCP